MSGRRLITCIAAVKIPAVSTCSNIRAIHVLPTIAACSLRNFRDDTNIDRYRRFLVPDSSSFRTLHRHKSGKKKKKPAQDDESDDEEDFEEELVEQGGKNAKIVAMTVSSMRIDSIVKVAIGMSRTKAEVALYESKIRVNGEKVLKKSAQARIGDVIDVIRGPSPHNPDFLVVSRITMLTAANHENGYKIKFIRDKSLVIENYEDGWSPVSNE